MKLKLAIEPIPQSSWGISLANKLGREEWGRISKQVKEEAGWTCVICRETSLTLHAHEIWSFIKIRGKKEGIQKLLDIICICETCHDCAHFGRSSQVYDKSYIEILKSHFKKINKISDKEFMLYLDKIKKISYERANIFWIVKVGNRLLG